MLYTIISEYDIFTRSEKLTRFMDIGNGKVEYTVSGKNKVVKSLFSTDPKVYLEERYQPGKRIVGADIIRPNQSTYEKAGG